VALSPGAAIADEDLALLRGGFSFGEMQINFGATVHTYIDGALALQTNLTVAPGGGWVTESVQNHLPPDSGWMPITGGDTPPNIPGLSDLLTGAAGIVKVTDDKATAVLQILPSGRPGNVIVNEATGADILQTLQLDITIGNHASMVQQMARARATEFGRIGLTELVNGLPR